MFGTTELAQGQIESLNYFLDMVQAYLQGVISDTENETEENRLQAAEELIELEKIQKWINPMGPPETETDEITEEEENDRLK